MAFSRKTLLAILVSLSLVTCFGCGGESKDSGSRAKQSAQSHSGKQQADSPSKQAANPAHAPYPGGSGDMTPKIATQVSIDELLKRKGLHKNVLAELRQMKARGKTTIYENAIEPMVEQFDVMVAIEKRRTVHPKPTQAKTEHTEPAENFQVEPTTTFDYVRGRAKFREIGIEHFKIRKIENLSVAGKAEALKIIEATIRSWNALNKEGFWATLYDEAIALQAKEPALTIEPMFQTCFGAIATFDGRHEEAVIPFQKCNRYFPETDYPARITILPNEMLNWRKDERLKSKKMARHLADYFYSIEYWMENDFRVQPKDYRYAGEIFSDFIMYCSKNGEWEVLELFMDSFTEQIHLPKWIRAMVRGHYYERLAWSYRGTGFANKVSDEGWQKFDLYQKKSADFYVEAQKIQPMFPAAAADLMELSLTGYSKESQEYWFKKSIMGQVDFMPAYQTRLNGLLPQWGGSVEEMVEFATEQAALEQYDTLVPSVMLKCYTMVQTRSSDKEAKAKFLRDPKFIGNVSKAIDGLVTSERSKVKYSDTYLLTAKAAITQMAGMHEEACEAYEALSEGYSPAALAEFAIANITFANFRSRSYAFSGESKLDAEALLKALDDPDLTKEDGAKTYAFLLELKEKYADTKAGTFFNRIYNTLELQNNYLKGQTVQLEFDDALSYWTFTDLTALTLNPSPNSISIDNQKLSTDTDMTAVLVFPGNKVVEFEIELPDTNRQVPNGQILTPSFSVANVRGQIFSFGLSRSFGRRWVDGARLPDHVHDRGQIAFGYHRFTRGNYKAMSYSVDLAEKNKLKIYIGKGYYEVFLNDQFVFRSKNEIIKGSLDTRFRLGQPLSRKGRGKFEISNIRFKKWNDETPPIDGPVEALIEYYQADVERDPKNKWNRFWLAQAVHKSGDFAKAMDHYQEAIKLGLNKSDAGFYLGDCYEQQNDLSNAIKWYKIAAEPEFADRSKVFSNKAYCNANHWASFRLYWLLMTSPDPEIREKAKTDQWVKVGLPLADEWGTQVLNAVFMAKEGKFEEAEPIVRKALANCSVEQEEVLLAIIESIEAKKVYYQKTGEKPFYLTFENAIPFFRTFEDALHVNWERSY